MNHDNEVFEPWSLYLWNLSIFLKKRVNMGNQKIKKEPGEFCKKLLDAIKIYFLSQMIFFIMNRIDSDIHSVIL